MIFFGALEHSIPEIITDIRAGLTLVLGPLYIYI